jgi:hypothetical protein
MTTTVRMVFKPLERGVKPRLEEFYHAVAERGSTSYNYPTVRQATPAIIASILYFSLVANLFCGIGIISWITLCPKMSHQLPDMIRRLMGLGGIGLTMLSLIVLLAMIGPPEEDIQEWRRHRTEAITFKKKERSR